MVFGDEIQFYYGGRAYRTGGNYHGDTDTRSGVGLATLRLDGFVAINAENQDTMTTKSFVFIGDTLEVNANAAGGSIRAEALDPEGNVIKGFVKNRTAITTDSVRHVLKWKNNIDCYLIQARPIKLQLYLKKQNPIPLYPVFGTIIIFRGHRRKHDSAVLNHMFFSFGWSCGYPCSAPTFPNSIASSASAVPLQNHADLGRGKFLYRQGPTYDSVIYSDSAGSHRTQFEQLEAVNPVS